MLSNIPAMLDNIFGHFVNKAGILPFFAVLFNYLSLLVDLLTYNIR